MAHFILQPPVVITDNLANVFIYFYFFLYPNTEIQAQNITVISIKRLQWVALHKYHPEVFVLISSTKIQKNSL